MPMAAPDMPRKMLPPPITRHNSTPSRCTASTSAATWATIGGSSPYSRSPISASPDSFSSTRRYLNAPDFGARDGSHPSSAPIDHRPSYRGSQPIKPYPAGLSDSAHDRTRVNLP